MISSHLLSVAALLLASSPDVAAQQLGYAPLKGLCPAGAGPYVRAASGGVNPKEAAYVAKRYQSASASLATWLQKVNPNFPALAADQYPMLGLVDGGGGLRGFTISAGLHKAFDGEEPDAANYSTSGLYQAFTYETALSGTALSLYSYVQSNWALTSKLLTDLWLPSFAADIAKPPAGSTAGITADVAAKQAAGFLTSLTDLWSRILSQGVFYGPNPGESPLISQFVDLPGIKSFARPYPITTAIGIEHDIDGCGLPPKNASQYEFTMHEFGSWETGIGNFVQSKYLGSNFLGGTPVANLCTTGFDNVGWVAATSSSTFNQACGDQRNQGDAFFDKASLSFLDTTFATVLGTGQQTNYALAPNPFYSVASAPRVKGNPKLTLVDGGETIQVPPIWPFLYRPEVDVLVVSDNSADSPSNYLGPNQKPHLINLPSGQQIYHTFQQAQLNNVSYRMPYIPPPATFMARNYNKAPMTFFGCNLTPSSPAMFIIYMPNRPVVFNSNIRATVTQYDQNTTLGMIANGEAIATNNGDPQFATCMACGLMKKAAGRAGKSLPKACNACFKTYCSN